MSHIIKNGLGSSLKERIIGDKQAPMYSRDQFAEIAIELPLYFLDNVVLNSTTLTLTLVSRKLRS